MKFNAYANLEFDIYNPLIRKLINPNSKFVNGYADFEFSHLEYKTYLTICHRMVRKQDRVSRYLKD